MSQPSARGGPVRSGGGDSGSISALLSSTLSPPFARRGAAAAPTAGGRSSTQQPPAEPTTTLHSWTAQAEAPRGGLLRPTRGVQPPPAEFDQFLGAVLGPSAASSRSADSDAAAPAVEPDLLRESEATRDRREQQLAHHQLHSGAPSSSHSILLSPQHPLSSYAPTSPDHYDSQAASPVHSPHSQLDSSRSPAFTHSISHSRDRSLDEATPRSSTNSFGYGEFALSENVFVLTAPLTPAYNSRPPVDEDTSDLSHISSLDRSTDEASPEPAASSPYVTTIDATQKATWKTEMDAFLANLLPADSSLAPAQAASYQRKKQQHQSRSPQQTRQSASPLSPSSVADSLNTSGLSQMYLPSNGAGGGLLALAHLEEPADRRRRDMGRLPRRQRSRTPSQEREAPQPMPQHRMTDAAHTRQQQQQQQSSRQASSAASLSSSTAGLQAAPSQHGRPLSVKNIAPVSYAQDSHSFISAARSSNAAVSTRPASAAHPSSKLASAHLYDDHLSQPLNQRLTQAVHEGLYRPPSPAQMAWTTDEFTSTAAPAASKTKAPVKRAATSDASRPQRPTSAQQQNKVPVLSVTSGPKPVVVAKVTANNSSQRAAAAAAAGAGRTVAQPRKPQHQHQRQRSYPLAKPIPREEYEYEEPAHDDQSYENLDLDDDQNLLEPEPEPAFPPPRPNARHAAQVHPLAFGSYAAQSGLYHADTNADEVAVEAELMQIDGALAASSEVHKLREEVTMLRAESGYLELFDSYEHTISELHHQNAQLRTRVQKAELNPEVARGIRSPQRRTGSTDDAGGEVPMKQAHFRVMEAAHRRLQEEHNSLQTAYASLQKQARRFTLQQKQCSVLQARLGEQTAVVVRHNKELATARKTQAADQALQGELKALIMELTMKANEEAAARTVADETTTKLRREVEALTSALFDARSASILAAASASVSSNGRSAKALKRPANRARFLESAHELEDLESLFIEQRRPDTPINLVTIANRKGLELCNRLRTRIAVLDSEKIAAQDNEKALLMHVVKMQEKKTPR